MGASDRSALDRGLASLSREALIAFGLGCCERLYPNYVAFKRETGWGEPDVLRKGLDLAWRVLEGFESSHDSVSSARQEVRRAEPETEDFDTILVSPALDAAAAVGLILKFIAEGGVGTIVEIASLCTDTVDMFVQDQDGLAPNDPKLEERILNHRLMQRELQRQHDDLLALRSFSGLPTEVARLRESWRNPQKSNIDQSGPRLTLLVMLGRFGQIVLGASAVLASCRSRPSRWATGGSRRTAGARRRCGWRTMRSRWPARRW